MNLSRRTARNSSRAVALSAAAVISAAPAYADPPLLNGEYQGDDQEFAWTIATSCSPADCHGTVSSNQGWTSPMHLVDGLWKFDITKPDGGLCADGSYAPAIIRISIDPVSLVGVVTTSSDGECPGSTLSSKPFQLHQLG